MVFHLGGAVSRVPGDATACAGRNAPHNININGVWRPDEDLAESETAFVTSSTRSNPIEKVSTSTFSTPTMALNGYAKRTVSTLTGGSPGSKPNSTSDNVFHRNHNLGPAA